MRGEIGVIFFTVLIDLIGFGILIPLLPFYALEFGANSYQIGLLVSSFSFMQFIFNPMWGKISDKIGRRPVILISIFGSFVAYLIFAFANSFYVLLFSRLLAGLMGASIATAQAYVADITSMEKRTKGMGIVGAGIGIGFVVGPLIGGLLSRFGYNLPIFFAAGLSFLNFILAYKFLPEPQKHYPISKSSGSVLELIHNKDIILLYFLFFAVTFSVSLNYVSFPLFTKDMFSFNVSHNGLLFGYIGIIGVLTQGYFVRRLVKLFKEKDLLIVGTLFMTIGLLGIALSYSFFAFLTFVTFLSFGSGLINPTLLSLITKQVGSRFLGVTVGFGQSLSSLARLLGPSVGGFFYGNFGYKLTFALGAIIAGLGFFFTVLSSRAKVKI